MRAYHIRTIEPSPYDIGLGLDTFDLDSIYIPEKKILIGIAHYEEHQSNKGTILHYSHLPYTDRAQKIVEGNRDGVRGDVIKELELDDEKIKKISEKRRYNKERVKFNQVFDGSTNKLVKILSGFMRKPIFGL